MLKTSSDNHQLLTFHESWIPVVIALGALVVSISTLLANKRKIDAEAMLQCFKLLSDPEVKRCKKIIAGEWRKNFAAGRPNLYKLGDEIIACAEHLISAYNQVSALYQLKLLDKKHFKAVYGGNVVRTWNLLSEEIADREKIAGKDYAKHFRDVAKELMDDGIDGNPY